MKIMVADKEWDLDFMSEEYFTDKFDTEVLFRDVYEKLDPSLRDKPYTVTPFFRPSRPEEPFTNNIFVSVSGLIEQMRMNWPSHLLNKEFEGEVYFIYRDKENVMHKTALDIKKKEVPKSYESKR